VTEAELNIPTDRVPVRETGRRTRSGTAGFKPAPTMHRRAGYLILPDSVLGSAILQCAMSYSVRTVHAGRACYTAIPAFAPLQHRTAQSIILPDSLKPPIRLDDDYKMKRREHYEPYEMPLWGYNQRHARSKPG